MSEIPHAQRERIASPDFYKLLQEEVARRLLAGYAAYALPTAGAMGTAGYQP